MELYKLLFKLIKRGKPDAFIFLIFLLICMLAFILDDESMHTNEYRYNTNREIEVV